MNLLYNSYENEFSKDCNRIKLRILHKDIKLTNIKIPNLIKK